MTTKKIPASELDTTLAAIQEEFFQNFLAEMSEELVNNTPVDTGFLKGSTELTTSASDIGEGHRDSSGTSTINTMQEVAMKATTDQNYVFINTAPYAEFVNNGSSKKSPNRFMERTMVKTQDTANKAAGDIK